MSQQDAICAMVQEHCKKAQAQLSDIQKLAQRMGDCCLENNEKQKGDVKKQSPTARPGKKGKLSGKIIVFTGTLSIKRDDAKAMAMKAGAIKVKDSVTYDTDILVAGPGAGTKLQEAKRKKVQVWDEDQFLTACQ